MSKATIKPNTPPVHTPPLGYAVFTPLYDIAIALLTREKLWRRRLVQALAPQENDRILDVGSGTGSLALAIYRHSPASSYLGIDPDTDAIDRARRKVEKAGVNAQFSKGYLTKDTFIDGETPTKIVSSLVLHQVPIDEKRRILDSMFAVLQSGGTIHIADYGEQSSRLMKALFRITVQSLDGVSDTQPNADGVIPKLMTEAGFSGVEEHERIPTLTGMIAIYRGVKNEGASAKMRLDHMRNDSAVRVASRSSGDFSEMNEGDE